MSRGFLEIDFREFIPMVATYHDHRMAMAFAPLAIREGDFFICHPEVVSKSYPTYWADLKKAGFVLTEHPEDETEIRQRIDIAEKHRQRVHTHAKWVLNTILILLGALLLVWIVKG